MKSKMTNPGVMVGVVLALAFVWLVWPTPWRYDKLRSMTLRTNRFTSRVEMLTTNGWQRQTEYDQPATMLSSNDLAQVEADNVVLGSTGSLTASVYNGALNDIDGEVICTVTMIDKQGGVLAERRLRSSVHWPSRQVQAFAVETGIPYADAKPSCTIAFERIGEAENRQSQYDRIVNRLRQTSQVNDARVIALRAELVRRGAIVDNNKEETTFTHNALQSAMNRAVGTEATDDVSVVQAMLKKAMNGGTAQSMIDSLDEYAKTRPKDQVFAIGTNVVSIPSVITQNDVQSAIKHEYLRRMNMPDTELRIEDFLPHPKPEPVAKPAPKLSAADFGLPAIPTAPGSKVPKQSPPKPAATPSAKLGDSVRNSHQLK